MIRVLLVDDHSVVRAGLERLLATADDIEVVGSAGGGAEAVALAATTRPDVILMDLSMPGVDGVEATRRITAADTAVRVVVLTSFGDRAQILEAVDGGASGYLLKDVEPQELLQGVRAAALGQSPMSPRAARALVDERAERRGREKLTGRELEVLGLVGAGLANKQIARRLGISEKTVKAHLTAIFQRLGVTDRTQAALWAQREALDTPET